MCIRDRLAGILLSLVFLFLMGKVRGSVYLTNVGETCNKGCQSAVSAIMNTAAAVGFGSVVKITPGFAFLSELVLGIGGSPLIAESIAINVLAGATDVYKRQHKKDAMCLMLTTSASSG